MKTCPNCNASYDDSMMFCLQCGAQLVEAPEAAQPAQEAQAVPETQPTPEAQPVYNAQQPYQQAYAAPQYQPVPAADPADHTAEFDAEDIAENKLYAMLVYLMGGIGIIIALLAAKNSGFVKFHVRQAVKFFVVNTILIFFTAALCWTFIVPAVTSVCMCIVAVLEIIAFVQACKGLAKEPAIIKGIKFLK